MGTLVAVTDLEYHGQIATSICVPILFVFLYLYSCLYLYLYLYLICTEDDVDGDLGGCDRSGVSRSDTGQRYHAYHRLTHSGARGIRLSGCILVYQVQVQYSIVVSDKIRRYPVTAPDNLRP